MAFELTDLLAPSGVFGTVVAVRAIGDLEAAWNVEVERRQADLMERFEQARADADTNPRESAGTPAVYVEFEGVWSHRDGFPSIADAVASGLRQSYLNSTSRVLVYDADGQVESSYDRAHGFWIDHRTASAE